MESHQVKQIDSLRQEPGSLIFAAHLFNSTSPTPTPTLQRMTSSDSSSLSCFPEELLLRILSLCVSPPAILPIPVPRSPLHAWDYVSDHSLIIKASPYSQPLARTRLALLCVSRQFHRITLPLFYHTLHLQSAKQLAGALKALKRRPALTPAVRKVVLSAIWQDCDVLLALCERVDDMDICLDLGRDRSSGVGDMEAEAFCAALARRDIFRMTIRKDPVAYLTHDRPRYMLEGLAQAIPRWSNLVSTQNDYFSALIHSFRRVFI